MEGLFSLLLFAGLFYFMMRFGCGAHMVHGHRGHEGHEQGKSGAVGSAIDPVCGMAVAADQGEGRHYRFCSRNCLDKFEANPGQYLPPRGGAR